MTETPESNVTYNVVEQPSTRQQLTTAAIQIATPVVLIGGVFGLATVADKVSAYRARRRAAKVAAQTETTK